MPVVVGSVAGVGLDYLGFAGKVSRGEALAFPERVDAEMPDGASRWITVFQPGADVSVLDADCMRDIKARLKPIVARTMAVRPFRMIMVADSIRSAEVVARWRQMTVPDASYASKPEAAASIEAACRLHGLTPEAIAEVISEIERDLTHAEVLNRAERD
jgi:hypothetical protein